MNIAPTLRGRIDEALYLLCAYYKIHCAETDWKIREAIVSLCPRLEGVPPDEAFDYIDKRQEGRDQ